YSVDEAAVSGYTKSLGANCSGTIANGQTKSCTITNDDQAATLTVIKHVIDNNGGTATAANFTMTLSAGSPASFPGAESPGTAVTTNANTAYSFGETGATGCARSNSTACASSIGLAPGGSATCTVTNDDHAPQLTVIKHVINNNGGTATAASFTM